MMCDMNVFLPTIALSFHSLRAEWLITAYAILDDSQHILTTHFFLFLYY